MHYKTYHFSKNKYNTQLMVDAAWIKNLGGFDYSARPYKISFYDITLVTKGIGEFWIDEHCINVQPGTVLFTSPQSIRRSNVVGLDGFALFFTECFITEHFNDVLFLRKLRFFHTNGNVPAVNLDEDIAAKMLGLLVDMKTEITSISPDSDHLLRAIAYQALVILNRWYVKSVGQTIEEPTSSKIAHFRELLEHNYKQHQDISFYTDLLCLTNNHLNYLCKRYLKQNAKSVIKNRVLTEACKLLIHSNMNIQTIAHELGFSDPSYFSKYFTLVYKVSPKDYRNRNQKLSGFSENLY